MALYMDKKGEIKTISPPNNLTENEKKILEESQVDNNLIEEALKLNVKICFANGENKSNLIGGVFKS